MNFQAELETLIRARYPILYGVTSEESRVKNLIVEISRRLQASSANLPTPKPVWWQLFFGGAQS